MCPGFQELQRGGSEEASHSRGDRHWTVNIKKPEHSVTLPVMSPPVGPLPVKPLPVGLHALPLSIVPVAQLPVVLLPVNQFLSLLFYVTFAQVWSDSELVLGSPVTHVYRGHGAFSTILYRQVNFFY